MGNKTTAHRPGTPGGRGRHDQGTCQAMEQGPVCGAGVGTDRHDKQKEEKKKTKRTNSGAGQAWRAILTTPA